jgi:acyl-CoA hydrolase
LNLKPGLLLALLGALALAGCSGHKAEPLPPGTVVLALGDSITAGYGLAPDTAWPARLAVKTGWTVINGGVSGDMSADALARLPALLDAHAPRLVLVELGGNDMLRKLPEAETSANLAEALHIIRAHGATPMLMAIPRPSLVGAALQNLSPPKFYRKLADAEKVPLIEGAIGDVLSDPALKLDPLHPNAEGHEALANKTLAALRELGAAR